MSHLPSAGLALGRPASLAAEFPGVGDPAQGLGSHWKSRCALSAAKWCTAVYFCSLGLNKAAGRDDREAEAVLVSEFPPYLHPVCSALPTSPERRKKGAVIDSWEKAGLGAVSPLWSTHVEEGSSFSSL